MSKEEYLVQTGDTIVFKRLKEMLRPADHMGFIYSKEEIDEMIEGLKRYRDTVNFDMVAKSNDRLLNRYTEEMYHTSEPEKKQEAKVISGYVYVIRADNGVYKIGKSRSIKERINYFNTKLPYAVEVMCVIETNDYTATEKGLHEAYNDKRVNGEWFELSISDVEDIKDDFKSFIVKDSGILL